jgi:hypothetical protein
MLRKIISGCTALSIHMEGIITCNMAILANVITNIPDVRIVFFVVKQIFPKRI